MGNFADELANAAREGQKKRKRLEEYERDSLGEKLEREWTPFKRAIMKEAYSNGDTRYVIPFDTRRNQEYHPSAADLREKLPEDLQDLLTAEGCDVRFECGHDGPNTWHIIISVTGRVNALNDKDMGVKREAIIKNEPS